MKIIKIIILIIFVTTFHLLAQDSGPKFKTVALWLFDEQQGTYPSSVLNDSSPNDFPLVLGQGGMIVQGKFGNALEPVRVQKESYPSGEAKYGLKQLPSPPGRKIPPMSWMNADFCALMTMGQKHLRKDVGFLNPTKSKLNLGDFDWTVEFWFKPVKRTGQSGVVFEIGEGPRGENDKITRLSLDPDLKNFVLYNQPAGTKIKIPSDPDALSPQNNQWHHFAFVYSSDKKMLYHYVDGKMQGNPANCSLLALHPGDEAFMSIGRDGTWKDPLQGKLDELRFSEGIVYNGNFKVPESFSPFYNGGYKPAKLRKSQPLLFPANKKTSLPIKLGSRKYVFIDGAIIDKMKNIKFAVNPPKDIKMVFDDIGKSFRKHLTVVQDDSGLIRIYNSYGDDYLGVITSRDGEHFIKPDFGMHHKMDKNIVIPESVGGLGNPFIDPNGPQDEKWKYITGYHDRGIYLYTSPDGWHWKRWPTYLLPFRSGTQSCSFYDDQRGMYIGYHRTGIFRTPGGVTQRSSVITQETDVHQPWKFHPLSWQESLDSAKVLPLRKPQPWYLDNGPLSPPAPGLEFPHLFGPDSADPVGTDFYVTKAQKYQWAPDTYLAFPLAYFHYEKDGPPTRQVLGAPQMDRGSGPLETQIAISRDGVHWKRFGRPAYVGIGTYCGDTLHQIYMADGMVKRGNEIWQYFFGNEEYHSSWIKKKLRKAVYRVTQRIDGFISADSPYDKYGEIKTKPLIFNGNKLVLNINTGATGYAQVGLLDKKGKPIDGYSVDDCIYINGNFINTGVQWLRKGSDLSSLQGKVVQVVIRMRGSKLYSMQFINN
jgi:hypothetical protein